MTPTRILIIKPSSLGDVATTLPLLCDLHAAFPDAHIDWLIHPALMALVEGHDAIHELVPFDRSKLASWWYRPSALGLFRELLKTLRANRYDLVIDAQGLFRSGFLSYATRAKTRIGFAHAREGARLAYTHRVTLPEKGRKIVAVERMRSLLEPLGVKALMPAQARVPINAAAASKARTWLGESRPVAVIPGARWDTKRWDLERYMEVVTKLVSDGTHVVLLGSPQEKPLCDRIAALDVGQGERLLNLAGQTTLAEMVAILAQSRLVIGNDSGPLHVAVALGRPVVAIYGPTSPAFVGPYGQLENVLRHDVSCHPCRLRTCDHHSCMKGVSVELVWEKTLGVLHNKALTTARGSEVAP